MGLSQQRTPMSGLLQRFSKLLSNKAEATKENETPGGQTDAEVSVETSAETPTTTPGEALNASGSSGESARDAEASPSSTARPSGTGSKSNKKKPRRNGISEQELRELKEKYRTPDPSPQTSQDKSAASLDNNNNNNTLTNSTSSSPSLSPSSSHSSSPTPSSTPSSSAPSSAASPSSSSPQSSRRKKKKMSSPRSTRRGESLRKAVLMQEEIKHMMTLDDVRMPDAEGNTPLHRGALLGNYEALAALCKKAPDIVNRLNTLHYASNSNCVNVLVWWGAGIDTKSSSGKTPLYCAVERGSSSDAVEALLQRGAKVNQKTHDEGWVPLHVACMRGYPFLLKIHKLVQVVEMLLTWNADVNVRDRRRATPLHFCASTKSRESEEICRLLLSRQVKICARDITGATPLHLACSSGNTTILAMILEQLVKNVPDAGYFVDNKGFTPYHYAAQAGYTECIDMLKRELPFCESWTDDCLLPFTSWGILKGHFVPEFYPQALIPFCVSFTPCVNQEDTSDVVFIVEGRPIYAHKVLCYTSPFLAKLIESASNPTASTPTAASTPSQPSTPTDATPASPRLKSKVSIEVKGVVSHKMFLEIMQFLYTGKIAKDTDWTQFWYVAVKLELLRLQQICEKELGGAPTRERSASGGNNRENNILTLSSSPIPIEEEDSLTSVSSLDTSSSSSSLTSSPSSPSPSSPSSSSPPPLFPSPPSPTLASPSSPTSASPSSATTAESVPVDANQAHSDEPTTLPNNELNFPDPNDVADTPPSPPPTTPPANTPLRRRASSRKRSSSSRSRMGVDPRIDYYLELSLGLRKFVGNSLFHDILFICGEEYVYAHKLILQNRCPNFFNVLTKNTLFNRSNVESVFHFDDITKAAMMGLMEYIYCGCFRTTMEPEDIWVLYNFVAKHGISCPSMKERAGYLFYSLMTPDNLLDLFALNNYGFTINPLTPSGDATTDNTKNIDPLTPNKRTSPPKLTSPINPAITNVIVPSRKSITINDMQNTSKAVGNTVNSPPHTPNPEITFIIMKYASKSAVLKFITKNSNSPNLKLLQKELRKQKTSELNPDTKQRWRERQDQVKDFAAKQKRPPPTPTTESRSRSDSVKKQ